MLNTFLNRHFRFNLRPVHVSIKGDRIEYYPLFGRIAVINMSELLEVAVLTTSDGPFGEDYFYVLKTRYGLYKIAQEAKGTDQLLEKLQTLDNFDNETLLLSISSVRDAKFICWEKPD